MRDSWATAFLSMAPLLLIRSRRELEVETIHRLRRFRTNKRHRIVDRVITALVRDAYSNVPMFRERLDSSGIDPSLIRTAADLRNLPTTSRAEYLAGGRMRSLRRGTDLTRCHTCQTSGTTGTPLTVYMNRYEALYRRFLLFPALRRNARLSVPFSIVEVGTSPVTVAVHRADVTQRIGLARVTKISRLLSVKEQVTRLLQASPQVITGHPSCLELIAEALRDSATAHAIHPRLVVPRGELLQPNTRTLLAEVFQCRVADYYNCEEVGNVAWECPDRPGIYHVNPDSCVVEVVDEEGGLAPFGTEGGVVVTNLFNRTMPFIRYELGDRATLLEPSNARCSCGNWGPSLSILAGRTDDFLMLPTGRRVSPRAVSGIICIASQRDDDRSVYFVRRYRVDQLAINHVRVRVVPANSFPQDLTSRIEEALKELDPSIRWDVDLVEDLPWEGLAKYRAIYSLAELSTRPGDE